MLCKDIYYLWKNLTNMVRLLTLFPSKQHLIACLKDVKEILIGTLAST